jgi:hypothetical protein
MIKQTTTMSERRTNEFAKLIGRDVKPVKAPYITPTLRTFGAVNQLTTGSFSGAGIDMSTMMWVMF